MFCYVTPHFGLSLLKHCKTTISPPPPDCLTFTESVVPNSISVGGGPLQITLLTQRREKCSIPYVRITGTRIADHILPDFKSRLAVPDGVQCHNY